jgi:hypothetical protein
MPELNNPVLAALALARHRAAPMFARWCDLRAASFCPASPAVVARFVSDCAALGISRLWPAVQDISRLHVSAGLADPTLGGAVAAAVSAVARIDPPRSWPDQQKLSFKLLPYDIQIFVAAHEQQREKALRRAQNDAAAARREIASRETSSTQPNEGADVHEAAANADA